MPALSTAKELREKRANLAAQMNDIVNTAETEKRDFTAEERTNLDKLHVDQEELRKKYEKIEADEQADADRVARARELGREMERTQGVRAGRQDSEDVEDRADNEPSEAESRAFESYIRYGLSGMTPEERALIAPREASSRSRERRAQGTSVDTAGGYMVPEGFFGRVVSALKFFGGMRQSRAFVFQTDSGNPLPIPTDNDVSNTGALLAENSQVSEQDVTVGQVVMNAYEYTSKLVRVSNQLLEDSAFDIQGWLSGKLGERLGRIQNTHFTNGDGAAKPWGVAAQSTQGTQGATGQTTSIIYDNLVDLEHSVDRAYRMQAQWMAHDSTIKALKKLKDGDGRPLWVPGVAIAAPDTILGYPFVVNNDVPEMAASAKSLLFGDFSLYFIRDVRGLRVLRLTERYADYNQVAFLAFSRHDGVLVDAGQNPIKHYANSAT